MKTQEVVEANRSFLIRPVAYECANIDYERLCQTIKRFGGVETGEGFAFATATQRALAADVLA